MFSAPVTAKVKVYLLYLADHMRADRTVSIPRRHVAVALGASERRVDDWNTAARQVGLLDVVVRGQKGVTAVYVALFPEPFSATKPSALNSPETVALKPPSARTPGVAPREGDHPPIGTQQQHPPHCSRCAQAQPCRCSHSERQARNA